MFSTAPISAEKSVHFAARSFPHHAAELSSAPPEENTATAAAVVVIERPASS